MLPGDTATIRSFNSNWVLLHYQLGMGASPAEYIRAVNGVAEWDGCMVDFYQWSAQRVHDE